MSYNYRHLRINVRLGRKWNKNYVLEPGLPPLYDCMLSPTSVGQPAEGLTPCQTSIKWAACLRNEEHGYRPASSPYTSLRSNQPRFSACISTNKATRRKHGSIMITHLWFDFDLAATWSMNRSRTHAKKGGQKLLAARASTQINH